jgi:hypothetical protein
MVQAHLGKKGDPICKITRTKWTGDMVQVESACLASMNPQYTHTHKIKMRYHFTPVRIALIT